MYTSSPAPALLSQPLGRRSKSIVASTSITYIRAAGGPRRPPLRARSAYSGSAAITSSSTPLSPASPCDLPVACLRRGPGCSSIGGGFLSELGPFYPTPGGSGLKPNAYAWNKMANVLFVDSPAFTGFSSSNDTSDLDVGELASALKLAQRSVRVQLHAGMYRVLALSFALCDKAVHSQPAGGPCESPRKGGPHSRRRRPHHRRPC